MAYVKRGKRNVERATMYVFLDMADLDWTYEETTSGRNYRNRWRGCFEREGEREKKERSCKNFFFLSQHKRSHAPVRT